MGKPEINKEATIYNYKLTRKLRYSNLYLYLYFSLVPLYLIFAVINFSLIGAFSSLLCFFFILMIHILLTWLFLKMNVQQPFYWSLRWRFPFAGFQPRSYTPFRLIYRIQWHLFWVGLALIGCLFPWSSTSILSHLLFVHLWLLFPRIVMLRSFKKEQSGGAVRLSKKSVSYYLL